jgi:FtsP/CotA-like multicopper oxidase with cupredoxin domain
MAVLYLLPAWNVPADAEIVGITGASFNLEAKADYISTSDGDSFLMWGYSNGGARMQYPGPTLMVQQNVPVRVTLTNRLPFPTSIVFPGQKVSAVGGTLGVLTQEAAANGGTVTYSFTPTQPGTYLYRSGTRADLQVEMGLVGALIVRPTGYDAVSNKIAYEHPDSAYDHEVLYLLTEMDPIIHNAVASGRPVDTTTFFPTNWFINGRNWPDVLADNFLPWLPTQPYNCLPRMHPGEKILLRCINAGVDTHPMHFHGNNFDAIAEDGRLLSSAPGAGADLAWKGVTRRFLAGKTTDLIWTWTGEYLGWDIYGHDPAVTYPRSAIHPAWSGNICDQYIEGDAATYFDPYTKEYCPDHGIPFPVVIPPRDSLTFGPFYSGSPFLGGGGDLPPGHPGLNAGGGYFYMWHSHTEKELTSNDIWPGGLVSFVIVEHPSVPIP